MQINKEQLVELLVQKTGLPQKQVEEQLSELITRVQQAAEQGKSFEIEKFGIFSVEEGELRFEPAEEFKTEINNKYAGMGPIEMIGAYEEAEDIEEPEADSDQADEDDEDIWGWDGDEEETPEEELDTVGESAEEGAPSDSSDSEESEEQPEFEEYKPAFELDEASTESPEEAEEVEVDFTEPVATETKPKKEFKTPGRPNRPKRKSAATGIFIAAAVVLVVALAGWLVYDMGGLSGSSTVDNSRGNTSGNQQATISTPQTPDPASEQAGGAADNVQSQQDQAPVESEAGPQSQDNQQNQQPSSEPEQENTVAESEGDQSAPPVYGLKGELNDNANDGYTIVVHSMQNEENAREMYNELNEKGYRTHLVSAIVNGEVFWRIGLGQFRTINAADSTAGQLPAPYSNNFFIKRIQ